MNRFVITGRFTRDIELHSTPTGKTVANPIVACKRNRNWKESDFFRVTLWEGLAETCAAHSGKGRLVAISGRIEHHVTGPEGQRRHHYDWIAEEVEFLDAKRPDDDNAEPAEAPNASIAEAA